MVPGMVGAVNYGSGKKAYDPLQTVAGKTGTCIGSGGWVGLFTSYAPLANPRLAVVVIAKGPDARRHFPAAVAGQIYRELNSRFGTPVNLQIASTPSGSSEDAKAADLNEEERDAAEAEAAEMEGEEEEAENETTAANTPSTPVPTIATPRNTVKPVMMPIDKYNPDPRKSSSKAAPTSTPALKTAAQPDGRPRRALP
jgi:hypothetical protein